MDRVNVNIKTHDPYMSEQKGMIYHVFKEQRTIDLVVLLWTHGTSQTTCRQNIFTFINMSIL